MVTRPRLLRFFREKPRPRHVFCVLVCLLLLGSLGWAQEAAQRVLVVVPARGHDLGHSSVDALVHRLKKARLLTQTEPQALPILRLDPARPQHKKVLRQLGVSPKSQGQVLVCSRADTGWPDTLLASFQDTDKAKTIVRTARLKGPVKASQKSGVSETPVQKTSELARDGNNATEVGLLLLHKPADQSESEQVRDFLSELGRHWLQRYGRIKPAPYPLAYYDLTKPDVVGRLKSFDQALVAGSPQAAICLFQRGRPQRVLEVYPSLELPASLVRRISSARSRHLADTVSVKVGQATSLPEPSSVRLSQSQQAAILMGRIHESAQQLWVGVSKDENPQNETSRRLLLRLVELSRHSKQPSSQELDELKLALGDLVEEPLLLPEDSHLQSIQQRLLELATALP